jgi:L-lysine 2,3-aminomutase
MLNEADFERMAALHRAGAEKKEIQALANEIRAGLNPHPAGQMELNLPRVNGEVINGLQHKYRETVLFFPAQGQTCHSYCTFCFRWAQFVGDKELRIASREADSLVAYLRGHPDVTDLLMTGGDPMVMKTSNLKQYLEPLLEDDLAHGAHRHQGADLLALPLRHRPGCRRAAGPAGSPGAGR